MSFVKVFDERTGKHVKYASQAAISRMITDMKRAQARLLEGKTIVDRSTPDLPFEPSTSAKLSRGRTAAGTICKKPRQTAGYNFASRKGLGVEYQTGDRLDRFVNASTPTVNRKGK